MQVAVAHMAEEQRVVAGPARVERGAAGIGEAADVGLGQADVEVDRSEEHTSELQSPCNLVCRLLLEKKKARQQAPPGVRPRSRSWCELRDVEHTVCLRIL